MILDKCLVVLVPKQAVPTVSSQWQLVFWVDSVPVNKFLGNTVVTANVTVLFSK